MKKISLVTEAYEYVKNHPGQKFEATQIADWAVRSLDGYCERRIVQNPKLKDPKKLIQKLAGEIGNPLSKRPYIKTTEDFPKKYYWAGKNDESGIEEAEAESPQANFSSGEPSFKEHDLYPKISEYIESEIGFRLERINEAKSSNIRGLGGNKWLYPDLVGMENLTVDWHKEIKTLVREADYAVKKTRLWSFEVKLLLNTSNLRESFFQAVSNSSWANFGYLAAAKIKGKETMKELRMLSSLHGIGLIRIDPENPTESQILIPARERPEIDWATCSRIAEANEDFREFVKQVQTFYRTYDLK